MRLYAGDLRPNLTVALDVTAGGYTPEMGWSPTSKKNVPAVYELASQLLPDQLDQHVGDDPNSTGNHDALWLTLKGTSGRHRSGRS